MQSTPLLESAAAKAGRLNRFLGLPIRYQGQNRGILHLANKKGADEFSEEDQTMIQMLADRVGIALEIVRLRQVETREHTRLEFLAKAGPLRAESNDFEKTLSAIARLVVPTAAELSVVDLLEGDAVRRVVAYHPERSKQELLERLLGIAPFDHLPEDVRTAIEMASRRPRMFRRSSTKPSRRWSHKLKAGQCS